jgi:hypothetical protein
MRVVLGEAVRNRPFLVMSGAYFVCGLNLIFLATHLPTYLAICGQDPMLSAEALAVIGGTNCIGSLAAGWLGGRYPKHILLGLLYILRAIVFTAYFVMPPTPASTLVFAAAMGMLWLSVAPLVSGLVAEMFGTRYMATLLGIAFVMHQVGSSLGAWGGGLIFDALGSYDRAWQLGVLIGFGAGIVQIVAGGPTRDREKHLARRYWSRRHASRLSVRLIVAKRASPGVGSRRMTSASVVMSRPRGRRSRNPQSLSERCALFSVKEKTLVIDQVVSKVAVLFHGGTSGSNPASSSGESRANLKTTSTFRCGVARPSLSARARQRHDETVGLPSD